MLNYIHLVEPAIFAPENHHLWHPQLCQARCENQVHGLSALFVANEEIVNNEDMLVTQFILSDSVVAGKDLAMDEFIAFAAF